MTSPARYLKFLICCVVLLALVTPSSANIHGKGVASRFILEQDGLEVNESFNYSINCYTLQDFEAIFTYHDTNKSEALRRHMSESFSTSGSCLFPECKIVKFSFYYPTMNEKVPLFVCSMDGTVNNRSFSVWNSTGIEGKWCYNPNDLYNTSRVINKTMRTYKYTPEYRDCAKKIRESIQYRQYRCSDYLTETDIQLPKGNLTQMGCAELYAKSVDTCDVYLEEVNVSWTGYEQTACEYRFQLPPENSNELLVNSTDMVQYIPSSPIASLYCSILSLLGSRC